MSITFPERSTRRADHPSSFTRRTSANFARQATISTFGWRYAKALDQSTFVDRLPGELPRPSPEARL